MPMIMNSTLIYVIDDFDKDDFIGDIDEFLYPEVYYEELLNLVLDKVVISPPDNIIRKIINSIY